ncbi:chromosome segregation protein SMC [Priestia aryabhattai]|uniref:Chromosome partition protein Smc n=1 Tax=Priestia aryabhattai TaxID=412384 RepID=A0AAX6NFE9_PRIAR|nr:chromosome segregation protein SMC [Priestia aryabhattai]MDU9694235.1 chromosome segregation protein SMC [Priestia aryabhattai]
MLKKATFHGFKAFADRVEIDFSSGVTAVVGPNGSGKSNISDGIRWVMGETSAKSLRGGSMKDVIFSGCDTRKASIQAEVSIELDNRLRILPRMDMDTVVITRKAHISGKSEFFINEQPARLKDIQEIFLDTGLGSNSYSMISQEQTKRLLSEKVEERRAIFEEAAGIVMMKNEKETTEERLDEVEKDFVRLHDILKELERQVKPLQKQSEKAKQYVKIKTVLDETETDFLSFKFQRLSKEEQVVINDLNLKVNALNECTSKITDLEEKLKDVKEELKSLNTSIFSTQEEKAKIKENIDSLQSLISINEERIIQSESELSEVNGEIGEIEEKFSVSVEEFNSKKNRFQELEKLIFDNNQAKDKVVKDLFHLQIEITSSKDKTEHLREEIASLYNEYQEAKLRFEQYNRNEERFLNEMDSLSERKRNAEQNLSVSKETLESIQKEFQENSNVIQELSGKHQFHITELNNKQRLASEYNASLVQLESTLAKEKTTLDSLESSLENFEGYYEGVKNVLKNKSKLEGVLDVVSNLFTPVDGYEVALDSLLNASAQNIVVSTIQNAKKAVNFLKENRMGRATFVPLNDLTIRTFSNEELNIINKYKGISPALSSIHHSSELKPLFQHLIGRNLIATDMEAAVKFYEETRLKIKISTLDGDILQPGTISGGTRNKKGLISKRKEMDTLRESVKTNEQKLLETKENAQNLKRSIELITNEKESLLKALDLEKEKNGQIKLKLESAQHNLEIAKNNIKEQDVLVKDLKYQYEESKRTSSSLYNKYHEKENLHAQKNEELSSLIQQLRSNEELYNSAKQTETACLIEIEKYEEEKRNLTDFISEQENGKDSFEKRLEFLQTKKYSNETKIHTANEENVQYKEQLHTFSESFSSLNTSVNEQQMKKNEIQTYVDTSESSLTELRDSFTDLKEVNHKLEIQKTNYINQKEQIIKRAFEAYHLRENDLLQAQQLNINEEATEKEIKTLLKELKTIGSVNLESIKDFEELNERYQTEKAQLEDIKEAKKDLEMLLKDVSKEMTERFTVTFKEVSKHFEKIFVELFGGGHAKLSLEDPKKPLNSRILITAQPPGKKPKKIELLSGGEKNLTVCALVFAIIKASPSPFVYLDEIDAPLDDANVSRFAFYLKKFGEQTQFIVVTHRKGTMMAADSLFGVTQEEQGITTVFPYHLEQPSSPLEQSDTEVGT